MTKQEVEVKLLHMVRSGELQVPFTANPIHIADQKQMNGSLHLLMNCFDATLPEGWSLEEVTESVIFFPGCLVEFRVSGKEMPLKIRATDMTAFITTQRIFLEYGGYVEGVAKIKVSGFLEANFIHREFGLRVQLVWFKDPPVRPKSAISGEGKDANHTVPSDED